MRFSSGFVDWPRSRLAGVLVHFRFGISVLDQIALSIFGFALNLALIRALSATDYGIVSLWTTVGLLAIGVQDALVNGPLSTHLPATPDPASARGLEEAIATVNLLAIAAATGLVGLVNFSIDAEWAPHNITAALAIPLFVAAGMYREFYRSVAFSRNDMAMLLCTDGPYLAVTTACLAAMLVWPERYANLVSAFFAMSIGCIVARLFLGGWLSGPRLLPLRRGWWREYRRILHDVGWALLGVVTTHLHARSYVYVVVHLVGLAGLAAINVVGLLFRPVRIIATAWGRSALPDLTADLAAGRIDAFDRSMLRGLGAAAAASLAWYGALWFGWGALETHVFAGQYPDAWTLMWPWAIAASIDGVGHTITTGLRAAREFKVLAYATVLSAPATIVATSAFVLWHGYAWTMYGVALGSLVLVGIAAYRLYTVRRRILTHPAAPRAAPLEAAMPNLGQR